MSHNTPDTLLKLAAELNKLGGELTTVGGKLAQAAKALEEEAANVALVNAQRWGVDVQVSNVHDTDRRHCRLGECANAMCSGCC